MSFNIHTYNDGFSISPYTTNSLGLTQFTPEFKNLLYGSNNTSINETLSSINDKLSTANKIQGAGAITGGVAGLINAGTGIYSAITSAENAKKQLALAKENFEFQKGLANRNLTNQAKAFNQEVGARSALAAAYNRSDPNAQADYYNRWRVSEAGVGLADNSPNPYQKQAQQ